MRIAIFGVGAVGGYFGGRLAQAGEDVVFIARGQHLEVLRKDGLRVDSISGDFIAHPSLATDDLIEVGVVDVIIVGVKAWQVTEVAKTMQPLIGPETVVLSLQNGVEAPAQLSKILGAKHVVGGLCALISFIEEPGYIRHIGADPSIQFGELDNHSSERIENLRRVFEKTTGVIVKIPSDIQVALWRKFLLISSWSGIGSITRSPIGIFRSIPQTRQMLEQLMHEVISVAQACDINLSEDSIVKTLSFIDKLPFKGTASMQRDIMEGRPSELESQTGAIVRLGQEVGVETPLNSFIYNSLLPSELKARDQLQFTI